MSFGSKVEACRRALEWTQAQLAAHIGRSRKTVCRWEALTTRPTKEMREAMATVPGWQP